MRAHVSEPIGAAAELSSGQSRTAGGGLSRRPGGTSRAKNWPPSREEADVTKGCGALWLDRAGLVTLPREKEGAAKGEGEGSVDSVPLGDGASSVQVK